MLKASDRKQGDRNRRNRNRRHRGWCNGNQWQDIAELERYVRERLRGAVREHDRFGLVRRAPDDVVAGGGGAPQDVVAGRGRAPDGVVAIGATAVGAPYDVVTTGDGAPHDVVADERGAPHDVVAGGGAPQDVVAEGHRAPHDVVAREAQGFRRAPDDVVGPRVGGRLDEAVRQAMVPPEDLATPDLLCRHPFALLRIQVILRQTYRAERVQEPGALAKHAVTRIRLRGVLEKRLDQVRRQVRIRLQHQRDRIRT